jgi:uncharacterized protein YaiE (UPF0345 family)
VVPSIRLAVPAFLLSIGAIGAASPASGGTAAKEGASIVRGAARVRTNGSPDWRDAAVGDVLTAGLNVQATAEHPLEMTLPDGVTITLEPGSLAYLMPAAKLPSETNTWTRGYHLVLQDGELEVRMPPGPKGSHAFLVSTSAGTLTDWRGQLHVMVHREMTAAGIYEGALVVGSNGQGFPVYDGAGILMRKGIDPDKTRGIPAAPEWERSTSLALVAEQARATLDMGWATVEGAASYRVEVATDPGMDDAVLRVATTDAHYSPPEPSPGGRYWARVRAVGAEGIVGEWSTPRPLRVLRYKLPERAFVARDGAVVLPDGASLELSDHNGIQAAYENASRLARRIQLPLYWTGLTGPLRLTTEEPVRIVHLRDTELGGEASLLLARRQLRAEVDLTPKNARWPTDPIDARIVVEDPSGRIDVANEPVTVEAMLDLTPLPVAWQRHANVWIGRIPPRPAMQPCVVRVVVKDDRGSEIGRGFVEIEGAGVR